MFELSFLLIVFFFSLLFFKEKGWLFFPRIITFIFALFAVAMFNVNWIFSLAIEPWMALLFFVLLSFSCFFICIKNIKILPGIKKTSIILIIAAISFLVSSVYFEGDFSEPRYKLPDSGTHFLYMNQAAESGMMPLFSASRIWPASGFTSEWQFHHEQYFPGITGVYALFAYIVDIDNGVTKFQLFNALGCALLAIYFFAIVFGKGILPPRKIWLFLVALLGILGTTFNFLVASHTTQIWGLIFLFLFVDSFDSYIKKRGNFIVPSVALSAVAMTYFYWIPVAAIFSLIVLLRLYLNRHGLQLLIQKSLPLILGVIFSVGYILVALRLDMVSHAADEGGVAFKRELLSDALIVFPFALFQLCLIWFGGKKFKSGEIFGADFFGSGAIFAFILMILNYKGGIISHYTAIKVMYFAIPSAWMLFFVFIENNLSIRKKEDLILKARYFFNKKLGVWIVFSLIFSVVIFFAIRADVKPSILPIIRTNVELMKSGGPTPVLSNEQMKLLDDVKNLFPETINDGRIFIVAPADTALWTFAYSGIWSRSLSLLSQDENMNKKEIPMSIWSLNIANYTRWLSQDENKYLIFLDTKESRSWVESWNFILDDYEKIHSIGDNHLLKLKKNETQYSIPVFDPGKNEIAADGVSFLTRKSEDLIKGFAFKVWTKNAKDTKGKVLVSVASGDCANNEKNFIQKEIAFETDKTGKANKIVLEFDRLLEIKKDQSFCLSVNLLGKNDSQIGVFAKKDGNVDIRPIYIYKIMQKKND